LTAPQKAAAKLNATTVAPVAKSLVVKGTNTAFSLGYLSALGHAKVVLGGVQTLGQALDQLGALESDSRAKTITAVRGEMTAKKINPQHLDFRTDVLPEGPVIFYQPTVYTPEMQAQIKAAEAMQKQADAVVRAAAKKAKAK
jgi:hypothetical protein